MSAWALLAAAAAFVGAWALTAARTRRQASPVPAAVPTWLRPVLDAVEERRLRAQESSACLAEMPELLDILTLGLQAGLSFDGALDLYTERHDTTLAALLGEARASWALGLGSRAQALRSLADRLDLAAMGRFADAVSEALEFGVPLAATLERQSTAMRRDQRLQVEEEIERVPVKMLVPLGCLVVPAMLLAVLGPLMASALGSVG